MVIGADGVESKVGRWAGLMGPLKPKDIECCAEFMVNATDRQVNALLYSLRKMNVENIPVSSIYKTATTSGFPVIKMMRALL